MPEQLKMWWNKQEIKPVQLPEGFSVRRYQGEEDALKWIEITLDGLQDVIRTKESFDEIMLRKDGLLPENIFFICKGDEYIATITAVLEQNNRVGYVHMVGSQSAYRGLGLGTQLNRIILNCFDEYGCECAYLTTDDFRIPAIKSYLREGFLPVLNGEDMPSRWAEILRQIGVAEVDAVDDNGKPAGKIKAAAAK